MPAILSCAMVLALLVKLMVLVLLIALDKLLRSKIAVAVAEGVIAKVPVPKAPTAAAASVPLVTVVPPP